MSNFILLTSEFALNFDLVRSISFSRESAEVQIVWSDGKTQAFTGSKAEAIIDELIYGDNLIEKRGREDC